MSGFFFKDEKKRKQVDAYAMAGACPVLYSMVPECGEQVYSRKILPRRKLGLVYSCYFKAPVIFIYCIPRMKKNTEEVVFKWHTCAIPSSFEA